MYPFGLTVRVRRSERDRYGDTTVTERKPVEGCVKWPRTSAETADYSQTVATGYMLSVPAGSDLTASDEILLPGEPDEGPWWKVEGDPLPWGPSPFTGWAPGVIVALTRATG